MTLSDFIPGMAEAKLFIGAIVVVGGLSLGLMAKHEYDEAASLKTQLDTAKAETEQVRQDAQRVETGLIQVAKAAASRVVADTAIRDRIHAAPQSSSCVSSPAVGALLDGLRAQGGAVPAPPGAGRAAHVQPATGPTGSVGH